jgi:hypothetical protein
MSHLQKMLVRGWYVIVLLLLTFTHSCAKLPPSKNALSGKRLLVTLRFRSLVNPNYRYFFLINNASDQNAPGPVPVLNAPYGNGFATGSGGGQSGFTDFVRWDNLQPQGYGLYHVIGDPNRSNFIFEGQPVTFVAPDPTDPRTANQLRFEIDLSQLIVDSNGQPLTDPAQAAAAANALRFLQVNIVATDVVPRDVTTPVSKQVDSLGDSRSLLGATSFLVVDVTQIGRVYNNAAFVGQAIAEPDTLDVYNGNDPSLDLLDWSVEVRQVL